MGTPTCSSLCSFLSRATPRRDLDQAAVRSSARPVASRQALSEQPDRDPRRYEQRRLVTSSLKQALGGRAPAGPTEPSRTRGSGRGRGRRVRRFGHALLSGGATALRYEFSDTERRFSWPRGRRRAARESSFGARRRRNSHATHGALSGNPRVRSSNSWCERWPMRGSDRPTRAVRSWLRGGGA